MVSLSWKRGFGDPGVKSCALLTFRNKHTQGSLPPPTTGGKCHFLRLHDLEIESLVKASSAPLLVPLKGFVREIFVNFEVLKR